MMEKGKREWTATEKAFMIDAFGMPRCSSQWDVERQMERVAEMFGRVAVMEKVKRVEFKLGHKIGA